MSTPSMAIVPVDGVSRPAIRPSSVDLPLPDGPTIARRWPAETVEIERMEDGQRAAAARDGPRHLAQRDHEGDAVGEARSGWSARPHRVGDLARAARVRVDAICLIQSAHAGHAIEHERHERDVVLAATSLEGGRGTLVV